MVVPRCSRSGDVVETRVCPQWFVDCTSMAQRAVEAVESGSLQIHPSRYVSTWQQWLGNIRPWCVSRQLWWGHRIPAYYATVTANDSGGGNGGEEWVVARNEADALQAASLALGVPPNRITLRQDEDVLDTWFSSGLFPFAAFGWPEKTEDLHRFFPGHLLETGHDILFFWVARMVMLSLELTDRLPFKQICLHAMIRDARGRKMSKSLGNVIDPADIIQGSSLDALQTRVKSSALAPSEMEAALQANALDFPKGIPPCGTDALRFALCAYTAQGRDINLSVDRVVGYSAFCNKIWNATKFVTSHLLEAEEQDTPLEGNLLSHAASGIDSWILSRLCSTCDAVHAGFCSYNMSQVTSAIYNFLWHDFCDVYLECAKTRLNSPGAQNLEDRRQERLVIRSVLLRCVTDATLLLNPLMPYLSEELYHRLKAVPFAAHGTGVGKASACIASFPTGLGLRDELLEDDVADALKLAQAVRSCFILRCIPSSAVSST